MYVMQAVWKCKYQRTPAIAMSILTCSQSLAPNNAMSGKTYI